MARRRRGKPLPPGDPRRKGIANLKPIKPGEVRNPTGKNGRDRVDAFYAFADEIVTIPQGRGKPPLVGSRALLAKLALFNNVLVGDTQAQKLFIEQDVGKARQRVELSGPGGEPVKITYDDVRQKLAELAARATAKDDDADGTDQSDEE